VNSGTELDSAVSTMSQSLIVLHPVTPPPQRNFDSKTHTNCAKRYQAFTCVEYWCNTVCVFVYELYYSSAQVTGQNPWDFIQTLTPKELLKDIRKKGNMSASENDTKNRLLGEPDQLAETRR
jgi:hypothetical protein